VSLPTVWLIKLSEASWLSLLGFISTLLMVSTLVFVRIYYGELEDVDLNNTVGPDILLSLGVFTLSLSGHAALPQIYREMSKPDEFNKMLNVCFFIMFIIYASMGVIGYLTYGSLSNIIISTNLVENPGGVLPKITAGFIIAKNYLTLNPCVAVLCNSTEVMMGIEEARLKQRIYRSFVFLLAAGLSYLAIDSLPFLESLTSAVCTMLTSFIFPAIIFALLNKELKSWRIIFRSGFICTFGAAQMAMLAYGAINSLL